MAQSARIGDSVRADEFPPVQAPDLGLCLWRTQMGTKPSLITRVIVSAAAVASIATGIAVPIVSTVAPVTSVAGSGYMPHD